MVIELEDHLEVSPGLWLPQAIKIRQERRTKEDDAGSFVPITVTELSVEDLQINSPIDNTRFFPEYLPGTIIEDQVTERKTVLPGGDFLLDEVIVRAKSHFGWDRNTSRSTRSLNNPLLLLGVAGLSSVILVRLSIRRGRRSQEAKRKR